MGEGHDLHGLGAWEMVEAFRAGTCSPVDVCRSVLAHVERCEPHLHAMYALDPDGALATARESEARWRRGQARHVGGVSLDGVPATIKDNLAMRGVPTPLGTRATDPAPAAHDAPPVARLREAGAVLVGKTTMPDYGMLSSGLSSFHALARNPWNPAMNPGGSSAGAGAAAGAGYGPLHLGTDIGGSVRLPASWCGVVGFKPSLGRVPTDPPYMARATGPLTRTVRDAAMAMAVLSQPDARDHMSLPAQPIDWLALDRDVRGLRVGLLLEAGCGTPVDPQVRAAVESAAAIFESAGAVVEPMRPWMTPALLRGIDTFWRVRSGVDVRALDPARRDALLPVIRQWAEAGLGRSGEEVFDAYTQTFNARAATVAATRAFDVVLSPVSPNTSFPAQWAHPSNDVARAMDHIGFTVAFSMSEQPSISVPCAFDSNGVPIGLQISGRRFDDLGVLQVAAAWERMRPALRAWHPSLIESPRP